MSQDAPVVQVNRTSLWLASVGFLLLSIGAVGMGWFPGSDRFNFALQALGPLAIALALIIEWRTHVERRGWAALVLFIVAIITFGALWVPYAINPASLGTTAATQLGFLMSGIASICASIGTFLVMRRKESHLEHPTNSVNPQIKATFMQLLLFGLGTLLYGVDLIWVGEEDSNHGQFSLLAIALVMIMIAVISFEAHLTVQVGRPAVIITIVAFALYAAGFVLHSLPSWIDEEWRLTTGIQGFSYALGAVACGLAAVHKARAPMPLTSRR
jgi:hypothetical protein